MFVIVIIVFKNVSFLVCKELDCLSKRYRGAANTTEHNELISNAASESLNFLQQRHQHVRCYTTKGTPVQVSSRTISMEEDDGENVSFYLTFIGHS